MMTRDSTVAFDDSCRATRAPTAPAPSTSARTTGGRGRRAPAILLPVAGHRPSPGAAATRRSGRRRRERQAFDEELAWWSRLESNQRPRHARRRASITEDPKAPGRERTLPARHRRGEPPGGTTITLERFRAPRVHQLRGRSAAARYARCVTRRTWSARNLRSATPSYLP